MTDYIIIDDVEEITTIISGLLTIRYILNDNIQYLKYSKLDVYITYPDPREDDPDIALFFKEMITSAVLSNAVASYRGYKEVNCFNELTTAGMNESRLAFMNTDNTLANDEFLEEFFGEFDLWNKFNSIEELFKLAVDRLTDLLLGNDILQNNRHIMLGDLITSGIVIGISNDELKILDER